MVLRCDLLLQAQDKVWREIARAFSKVVPGVSEKMDYREAAHNMDWMQVLLNLLTGQKNAKDGQPCFDIDSRGIEPRFCGRAKFWVGHGHDIGCDHEFVSLVALLDKVRQAEIEQCAIEAGERSPEGVSSHTMLGDMWDERIRALGRK